MKWIMIARSNLRFTFLISCFLLLSSCLFAPGGGGSTQSAPDSVKAGEPIVMQLQLSVWGPGGGIKGRYTDIVAHYKLVGSDTYHSAAPKLVSQDHKRETYEIALPGYPQTGAVEYYLELKLDGHPSRIEGIKKIKIL